MRRLAVLMMLFAGSAAAQDPAGAAASAPTSDGAAECAAIPAAASRLACFDRFFPPARPEPAAPATGGGLIGGWVTEVQRDLMGGPDRAFVSVLAREHNAGRREPPMLAIRCGYAGDRLEILFEHGVFMPRPTERFMPDTAYGRMRFDDERPRGIAWNPGSARTGAFADDARRLFEELKRRHSVAIEIALQGRQPVSAEFAVAGLAGQEEALRRCLPELPPAEITRDHGIAAPLLDAVPGWHALRRGGAGPASAAPMLAYYGRIDTLTGNQDSIRFWCEGQAMVGRIAPAEPPGFAAAAIEVRWASNRDGPRERFALTRQDARNFGLQDPRRFLQRLGEQQPGQDGFFTATFYSAGDRDFRVASFRQPALPPGMAEVLRPCLAPPPRPRQGTG
jgi:hypothetical protein